MATRKKAPFKVGVVGESVFDTKAMRELLHRRYGHQMKFVAMPVRLDGGQLDGKKARTMFRLTYQDVRPQMVVVFRDLDGPVGNEAKRQERMHFFEVIDAEMENRGLLLLHVQAIEALLIAHMEVFQQKYGWQCRVPANPTTIPKPAQFLRDASRTSRQRYEKARCAEFMAQVSYEMLVNRCPYFAAFDREFTSRLPAGLTRRQPKPPSPPG